MSKPENELIAAYRIPWFASEKAKYPGGYTFSKTEPAGRRDLAQVAVAKRRMFDMIAKAAVEVDRDALHPGRGWGLPVEAECVMVPARSDIGLILSHNDTTPLFRKDSRTPKYYRDAARLAPVEGKGITIDYAAEADRQKVRPGLRIVPGGKNCQPS